jgi:hypothetical protein
MYSWAHKEIAMNSPEWQMPVPELGDCVLFSTDMRGFSDPTVGWVTGAGDTTISILTFTPGGFVQRHSVHHKDDPGILGDHGWHDLGCWKFSKGAATLRELTQPAEKSSGRNSGSK